MIRTIAKNHFEVRVYAGRDPLTDRERRVSRTIRGTKAQAKTLERELVDQIRSGGIGVRAVTVGEMLDRWLEVARVEDSTRHQGRWIIDNRIRPRIGKVRLADLSPAMIDRLYAQLERDGGKDGGLSPGSVLRVHVVLSSALGLALEWGWLPANPARRAHPPGETKPKPNPPAVEEVQKLIANAPEWLSVILRILAATGMRRGEVCALRLSDYQDGALRKARAVAIGRDGPYVKSTKTGVIHRLSLDRTTQGVLGAYLANLGERAAALDIPCQPDPYIFSNEPDGSEPLHPTVLSHAFATLRDSLGLNVQMKNLRHFHATQLIEAGVPITVVAYRLGHAKPAMTLNVYAGWLPSSDGDAAAAIEKVLAQSHLSLGPDPTILESDDGIVPQAFAGPLVGLEP